VSIGAGVSRVDAKRIWNLINAAVAIRLAIAIAYFRYDYISMSRPPAALDNYSGVYAVTRMNGSRDNYFNHEAITHFHVTPHSVREMMLTCVSGRIKRAITAA